VFTRNLNEFTVVDLTFLDVAHAGTSEKKTTGVTSFDLLTVFHAKIKKA